MTKPTKVARYELFRKSAKDSAATQEGGGYAVAIVLFDVVRQLVELNKKFSDMLSTLDSVAVSIDRIAETMDAG